MNARISCTCSYSRRDDKSTPDLWYVTRIEACFNPSYHGIVYHEFVFMLVSQGKLKSSIGGDIFVIHSRTFFSSGIVSL